MGKRGKLIVLYGINNVGKSTQAKLLIKALKKNKLKAEHIKYPLYDIEPAGKLINEYLRKGNPHQFTPREFQLLHYIDRITFEPTLKKKLEKGIHVVAEDYFGTAVAWGVGAGVEKKLLEYLYGFVYPEDQAILLDGYRFSKAVEKRHKHESDKQLTEKVSRIHRQLARKYGWHRVDANLPIGQVHTMIWDKVKGILK